MARGKVQIKRIENPAHRQVTFCKRRTGLFKKAKELSVLCDADIGIIMFSTQGKLYELATQGTTKDLIERYKKKCDGTQTEEGSKLNQPQDLEQEVSMLEQEIHLLQKGLRYMFGETTTETMTLDELLALERRLETWMYHIRGAKTQIMIQEIQSLKNKEGILKAANDLLQEKIVEQTGFFDVAPFIIEQNGFFNAAPGIGLDGLHTVAPVNEIADPPHPLTIQRYSNFRGSSCCWSQ